MPRAWTILAAALLAASPADALILGTGAGNTTPPLDDPGFDHVGRVSGGSSAIYLGAGWVLTASHVGIHDLNLGGTLYRAAQGSGIQLETSPTQLAELLLFRLESDPGLASLPIADASPTPGAAVVMIGAGRDRGAAITWQPPMGPPIDGWSWGFDPLPRWGSNLVDSVSILATAGSTTTWSFTTEFDAGAATADEAQAAEGDSGGAVFIDDPVAGWELAGVIFGIGTFTGQPAQSALFGNLTWSAQLESYRGAILAITADVACSNGVDDDGDGLVDHPDDPGCSGPGDAFERADGLVCDDGFDEDGDGWVDFPEDPGCASPSAPKEDPACQNGVDDDGDGRVDFDGGLSALGSPLAPPDMLCSQAWKDTETLRCGLGFEIAPLLALLGAVRRRVRGKR